MYNEKAAGAEVYVIEGASEDAKSMQQSGAHSQVTTLIGHPGFS